MVWKLKNWLFSKASSYSISKIPDHSLVPDPLFINTDIFSEHCKRIEIITYSQMASMENLKCKAERQRFGCLDTWQWNCKQTMYLRFPIGVTVLTWSNFLCRVSHVSLDSSISLVSLISLILLGVALIIVFSLFSLIALLAWLVW